MDTQTKNTITEAIISTTIHNNLTFYNACVLIEEYIFDKKQRREIFRPVLQTQEDVRLFNHFIEIAIAYFKVKLNCVKLFDKNNKLISIHFN